MRKILTRITGGFALLLIMLVFWPRETYTPHEVSPEYLAAAEVYAEENLRSMPEGWSWGAFKAEDGTMLRWGMVSAEVPKATLVFVPGYAGALEFYGEYFEQLVARGYRVVGFDLRGQGGSQRAFEDDPERMFAPSFATYSDDLSAFLRTLGYDEPLLLAGESFGGHASLRAVGDHATDVDGLVLIAPMFKVNPAPLPYGVAKVLVGVSRVLGKSKNYGVGIDKWSPFTPDLTQENLCGTHPDRLHTKDVLYTLKPELRVGGPTNQWLGESMRSASRITKTNYLQSIDIPVFMITASDEHIVLGKVSEEACLKGFKECTLVTPPNSRHCLNFERDEILQQIFDGMDKMVERVIAGKEAIAEN